MVVVRVMWSANRGVVRAWNKKKPKGKAKQNAQGWLDLFHALSWLLLIFLEHHNGVSIEQE